MFRNIFRHLTFTNQRQIRNYKIKIKKRAHERRMMSSGGDGCGGAAKKATTTDGLLPIYDKRRCWESLREKSDGLSNGPNFRLVSYNILAQDLLVEHMHLYYTIDPNLLRWEKRQNNLQKEIQKLNPDILCLQEMQFNHLKYFVKILRGGQRRLEYVFKKKTGSRTDGCAIIYDRDKFQLLAEQGVEYYVQSIPFLNRENVALMAKFRIRNENEEAGREFVVATTHLLYNPQRDDVRTAQIGVLRSALNCFAFNNGKQVPIILTGDFNLETTANSYVALQRVSELYSNTGDTISRLHLQPLIFGCNTASTYQDRWITVDYILYAQGNKNRNVNIGSIYKLPTLQTLERRGLIPNSFLGSDHYCLAISFSIT